MDDDENDPDVEVRSALGEMWGKNSAKIKEDSDLYNFHIRIQKLLVCEGFEMEERSPHIEIVKKSLERPAKGHLIRGDDVV